MSTPQRKITYTLTLNPSELNRIQRALETEQMDLQRLCDSDRITSWEYRKLLLEALTETMELRTDLCKITK